MQPDGRDIVLFLARDRFFLYDDGRISVLEIPPTIVKDIDVKNRDGLFNLVTSFIQSTKIVPAQIFFVLSEAVCFSKDFPIKNPQDAVRIEAEAEAFIDAIPFGSVVSKIYRSSATLRATGSNQDLVDVINDAFEAKGFGLTALVPANIFPEYGAKIDLNTNFAKAVIAKKDKVVEASMIGAKVAQDPDDTLSTSKPTTSKSKLLPFLIGGFALALLVLVILLTRR